MNKSRLPGLLPLLVLPVLHAEDTVNLPPVEVTAPLPADALLTQPVPITAYDGDLLTSIGVTTYDELAPLVPGFFTSPQSVENISLNLRGLTTDASDPRIPPRVPVFQDGVFIATPRGGAALFDMDNVEVIKGPQPTAFGRGVQNGALALTSNRAVDTTSGELTGGFGDNAARLATGYYNASIIPEKLFARVAFSYTENEGYVDNLTPGAENLQGVDTLAVRTSVRWQPAPDTTADLILNTQRDTPPGVAFKSMVIPTSRGDTDPYSAAELNRGDDLGIDRELWGLTGILQHRLSPAWQVTSTSAFRDIDSLNEFDADGSGLFLFEFGEQTYERQLSQELRFNYDAGGPLTGMIGAGAFWQEGRQDVTLRTDENVLFETFTGLPSPGLLPFYEESHTNRSEVLSADLFGRLDYKLTKKLTLGGGLRVIREHLTSGYQSYAAPVSGNLGGVLIPGSGGGNNVFAPTPGMLETRGDHDSWSGGLDSRYAFTSRHHAYASVARGRRSPVHTFNQTTFAEERLAEEVVWNYEVGFKGATPSRRIQYGVSVFHYDYENFQTDAFVGVVPTPVDGGRASGNGFELTLQGAVNAHLNLFATYGYTDAEFAARDEDGTPQAYAGNEFRLTARHAFSFGGTLALPAGDRGSVFVTPVVQYRSEQFFEDDNDAFGGQLRQGGFTLLNLRFGYRANNGRWDVTAFVNNVLDKEYLIDAGNIGLAFGFATTIRGAPRTCGLQTTVRF